MMHDSKQLYANNMSFNLPTAFWGLLGPRKDVMVDFIKTVSNHSGMIGMARVCPGVPKDPKK